MSRVVDPRLSRVFEPFIRDAGVTGGVALRIDPDVVDDGERIMGVIRDPRGSGSGVWVTSAGSIADDLDAAFDYFDQLQEDVIFYRAEVLGVFGPWPPCPEPGHTHKLRVGGTAWPEEAWWVCSGPDMHDVARLGELEGS